MRVLVDDLPLVPVDHAYLLLERLNDSNLYGITNSIVERKAQRLFESPRSFNSDLDRVQIRTSNGTNLDKNCAC